MVRIFARFLLLAILVAGSGTVAARAVPIESYGTLPDIEFVDLSPDSSKYVYVQRVSGTTQRVIVVQDVATGKRLKGFRIGDAKVRGLKWAGNDDLLIYSSMATNVIELLGPMREYWEVSHYNLSHNEQDGLFHEPVPGIKILNNAVAGVPAIRSIDGRPVAFVPGIYFPGNRSRIALFRIDLQSGKTVMIDGQSSDARNWVIAEDGSVLARADYSEETRVWSLNLKTADGWVTRDKETAPIDIPSLVGLDASGTGILTQKENEAGVQTIDTPFDTTKPRIDLGPDFDHVVIDHMTGRAVANVTEDEVTHFLDPVAERHWIAVTRAYPGERVQFVSRSSDGERLVVSVYGTTTGIAYAFVDLQKHLSTWIGDIYSAIKPDDLSPVQTIRYAAADGLSIPALLTLPRGKEAKKLPLIVLPHGGPQAHDRLGFDWWAQGLASQGYAVLQPQYRGSTGFGEQFVRAGYGQWGRKMQTDLSDGVRSLAKDGTIDPARVCIAGGSYGGYAALAGAAFDPGVYRCAVSVAGPADLSEMLDYEKTKKLRSDSSVTRYWLRFMGAASFDDPVLQAMSPADHADKITIPVLLIHGEDDTVVPFGQSRAMQRALEKARKSVKLVRLDDEDHWLSRAETRTQMLKASLDFLLANNPPN